MNKFLALFGFIALILLLPPEGLCEEGATTPNPLRAAIFVQNFAGKDLDAHLDALTNQLVARLTEAGLSVIDRRDVIAKFSESRHSDASTVKAVKALEQLEESGRTETRLEDALSGGSALRIAQMLRANYLVMISIESLSTEVRTFNGQGTSYGTNNQTTISNLRLAVKVLEGGRGSTVYGDVVTVSERIAVGEHLTIVTDDIVPRLIEAASVKVADNIAGKMEKIRNTNVAIPEEVEFSVTSNVEGSTVELDGTVIGSTPGKFKATPGVHQLRITKEWLTNWERIVNITPNQTIAVAQELSDEGLKRFTTLEKFKAEMEIAKKLAEGQKKRLENSYERMEGAPTTNIIH